MKKFKYTIDGKEYKVEISDINEETNVANVQVNGEAFEVEMEKPAEPEKKKVELGKPMAEDSKDDSSPAPAGNVDTAKAIKAPLPGTITAINVNVGDDVKAGDALLVLEAMKMANNIEAEKDGKVTAICVKVGQSVMEDEALVVVE
jgi:biotin carboxyl carrier protein